MKLSDELIARAANMKSEAINALVEQYGNPMRNIIAEFVAEWNAAPCDDEGATAEQDKILDEILERYEKKINELIGASKKDYHDYEKKMAWQFRCCGADRRRMRQGWTESGGLEVRKRRVV